MGAGPPLGFDAPAAVSSIRMGVARRVCSAYVPYHVVDARAADFVGDEKDVVVKVEPVDHFVGVHMPLSENAVAEWFDATRIFLALGVVDRRVAFQGRFRLPDACFGGVFIDPSVAPDVV